ALRDLPVLLAPRDVGRTRENRHQLRTALLGHADRVEHHPRRLHRQLLPPALELRIVGELIVSTQPEAERLLRSGEGSLRAQGRNQDRGNQEMTKTHGRLGDQRTENGERRTENREQRTENRDWRL